MHSEIRNILSLIRCNHSVSMAAELFQSFGEEHGIVDLNYKPAFTGNPVEAVEALIEFDVFLSKVNSIHHATCTPFDIDRKFSQTLAGLKCSHSLELQ